MGNSVSSSGFTKCSQCGVHIRANEACPFCQARRPGRGGVLAAGLLSVGLTTTACDDEDDKEPTPDDAQAVDGQSADAAEDALAPDLGGQPLYGIPADVGPPPVDMSPPEPDMAVMPLYGGPPDAAVPDANVMPPYGIPPDAGPTPDSGIVPPYGIPPEDAAVPPVDMEVPVPLYGIPPQDAAVPVDAAQDEGVAVPLYGIPPDRE